MLAEVDLNEEMNFEESLWLVSLGLVVQDKFGDVLGDLWDLLVRHCIHGIKKASLKSRTWPPMLQMVAWWFI